MSQGPTHNCCNNYTRSQLLRGAAAETPLQVRSPGIHVPPVGATVAITVVGAAHVFSA